jgi:hypothetical protein
MDEAPGALSASLQRARELAANEAGLAVVVTYRPDGTAHASVVNAGVVDHPRTGEPAVGFVVQGGGRQKLANLRARAVATVVFRSGWDWVALEGDVDLIGPHDDDWATSPNATDVFHDIYCSAIGGTPDDWRARDDAIEREGHVAVLLRPSRAYSNERAV